LRAAAEQKYAEPPLPVQYQSGYRQLSINLERAGQMAMLA
jgi:anthraniloyl-CoA monooxygenase